MDYRASRLFRRSRRLQRIQARSHPDGLARRIPGPPGLIAPAMKSLLNPADKEEILRRLDSVRPTSQRRWGSMSAHNMICHLCDGFRLYMGELLAKTAAVPVPRVLLKWFAFCAPVQWPHGVKTAPVTDYQVRVTHAVEFIADVSGSR